MRKNYPSPVYHQTISWVAWKDAIAKRPRLPYIYIYRQSPRSEHIFAYLSYSNLFLLTFWHSKDRTVLRTQLYFSLQAYATKMSNSQQKYLTVLTLHLLQKFAHFGDLACMYFRKPRIGHTKIKIGPYYKLFTIVMTLLKRNVFINL